ncbi:MAG: hypothetical protein VX672_05840 [Planctomycetota bacterium]|nr:hypothetical protein [Planctomycetota bacterium]
MSQISSIVRRRTARPGLAAALVLPLLLAGCASNPFVTNYTGSTQPLEGTPERLLKKEDLRRLGSSRFDIEMTAGSVPGDDQAQAAAREIGARSYWWSSRPKFHSGNDAARNMKSRGRIGQTRRGGTAFDEKTIKWYSYEAVFYADAPRPADRD